MQRHLYLIVPFFPAPRALRRDNNTQGVLSPEEVEAERRYQEEKRFYQEKITRFISWVDYYGSALEYDYRLDGQPLKVHELRLNPHSRFGLSGGATITYSPPQLPRGIKKQKDDETEIVGIPKGLAVRLALMVVLNDVDSRGVEQRENAFVVQIDGSGAFNYDSVFRVAEQLIRGGKPIVLGARPGDWLMKPRERKVIELFENALVLRACELLYGRKLELKDGQAGCWGLSASMLGKLCLSAPDYELEFDLLSSILMSGYQPDFTQELIGDERIGPPPATVIDYSDPRKTLRKFPFMLYKIGWSKAELGDFLDAYETEHNNDPERRLPQQYASLLRVWIRQG